MNALSNEGQFKVSLASRRGICFPIKCGWRRVWEKEKPQLRTNHHKEQQGHQVQKHNIKWVKNVGKLEIFKFYEGTYFQLNKTMGGRWRHSAVLKHVCSSAWDPEHILTRSAFAVKGFLFSDFWDFHHYGSKMWM